MFLEAETMMSVPDDSQAEGRLPGSGERPGQWVKQYSRIGAVFCAMLLFAILATTAWGLTLRNGDTGGAMGVGLMFVGLIPMASALVGLYCLVGVVLSLGALAKD